MKKSHYGKRRTRTGNGAGSFLEIRRTAQSAPRSLRVFLSSTAFDLADTRSEVVSALREWGYEPISFELPTFRVKPTQHSHDVCIDAVVGCDVYVLIISKRYGGLYAGAEHPEYKGLSITHAETRRALELGKPVLAFVRSEIWNERPLVKKNIAANVAVLPFHADNLKTYEFLDELVHEARNNWIRQFGTSVELKALLEASLEHLAVERRSARRTLAELVPADMLQIILRGLSHQFSMPFGVVTPEGEVYSYPTSMFSNYCYAIRCTEKGLALAHRADIDVAQRAIKEGRTIPYRCYTGLTDFAFPIIHENCPMGVLLTGQVRTEDMSPELRDSITRLAVDLSLDPKVLKTMYLDMPRLTEPEVTDCLERAGEALNYFLDLATRGSVYGPPQGTPIDRAATTAKPAMSDEELLNWLNVISEKELVLRVLIPLVERMGYLGIRYVHGPNEYGRDIVFYYPDPLGERIYCAAQVKKGGIRGKTGSSSGAIAVLRQLEAAATVPYPAPETMETVSVSQIWVVTAGAITDNARKCLKSGLANVKASVVLLDGRSLLAKIREFAPELIDMAGESGSA